MNDYFNMTREELAKITPDLSKMKAVRVNEYTTIFIDPARKTPEEIISKFKNYEKKIQTIEDTFSLYG